MDFKQSLMDTLERAGERLPSTTQVMRKIGNMSLLGAAYEIGTHDFGLAASWAIAGVASLAAARESRTADEAWAQTQATLEPGQTE
jgi:hypothetical protein